MRLIFDLQVKVCLFLAFLGFLVAAIGIKFSTKNLKRLLAWSSISNMRMLIVLLVFKKKLGFIFYFFYRVLVLIFCCSFSNSGKKIVCGSFLNGSDKVSNIFGGVLFLVFSGLPPFVSFLLKVYFLGGFFLFDSSKMISDVILKGKEISFFYLLGSYLQRWKVVLSFIFLIVLQSVGYIKAFILLNSTGSSRLSLLSNGLGVKFSFFLFGVLAVYILRIFLVWFF